MVTVCENERVGQPTNTQFAVGVHSLTLLAAEPDGLLSSEEIADSTGANSVYVRRVLGRLREAGIVSSRSGVKGGWALQREPSYVTLGDVWRAIQIDDPVLGLHVANPRCEAGQAIQRMLQGVERRVARALEDELDRTSVLDVLASAGTSTRQREAQPV